MKICPKCKKNLIFEDSSFNHEFGTEIIKGWLCEYCDFIDENDTFMN